MNVYPRSEALVGKTKREIVNTETVLNEHEVDNTGDIQSTCADIAQPQASKNTISVNGVKKRVRHRQSVKLHDKKLSIAVLCSNPYIKQFS